MHLVVGEGDLRAGSSQGSTPLFRTIFVFGSHSLKGYPNSSAQTPSLPLLPLFYHRASISPLQWVFTPCGAVRDLSDHRWYSNAYNIILSWFNHHLGIIIIHRVDREPHHLSTDLLLD